MSEKWIKTVIPPRECAILRFPSYLTCMKNLSLTLSLSTLALLIGCTATTPIDNTATSSSSAETVSSSSSNTSLEDGSGMTLQWKVFENTGSGYSISYPTDFILQKSDTLVTDDFQASGISFDFPEKFRDGNTLDQAKVTVAVQPTCPTLSTPSSNENINGTVFTNNTWGGAGAGNLYQGRTYTTVHNNKCYIVALYMHSCNLGPDCYEGHTTAFDKRPLEDIFETMIDSFKFL